jgi:F0F1-type ATP synthase membrane subunit b/b'
VTLRTYQHISDWSQIVAAILFIGVLVWLWVKYIMPAILTAQDRHNKQIAEAERHRDEAKAALDVLRGEIDTAGHDAHLIVGRADEQAQREHAATVEQAREAGERSMHNAQLEFDRAMDAAKERLRDELAGKALDRARERAEARVDASENAALVDRFLTSLERTRG